MCYNIARTHNFWSLNVYLLFSFLPSFLHSPSVFRAWNRLRVHFFPTHRQCRHPLPFKESQFGENLAIRWRHYRWVDERCKHNRIKPVTSSAKESLPFMSVVVLSGADISRPTYSLHLISIQPTATPRRDVVDLIPLSLRIPNKYQTWMNVTS